VVDVNETSTNREETLEEARDYPGLVGRSPHATPFHRPEWLSAVRDFTPGTVYLLRVLQGEETVAVLPHVHGHWGPLRVVLSPPARMGMQYLGPLIPDWTQLKQDKREARLAALANAVRVHLRETRSRACQIRGPPGLDDGRAFQWSGFEAVPRYTYVLDLANKEAIWDGMKKNVRSDIRRHENALPIAEADESDWRAFDHQVGGRYSEQGLRAPLPQGYLPQLRRALGTDLTLFVAKEDGGFLGGAALIRTGNRMALWLGTVRGPPGVPVNDLLVWHSIRYAGSLGCLQFELMGANTHRIADFKSKFNPTLQTYLEVRRLPLWAEAAWKVALKVNGGTRFR
jgi:Acetyltransferase (GNAT) domain